MFKLRTVPGAVARGPNVQPGEISRHQNRPDERLSAVLCWFFMTVEDGNRRRHHVSSNAYNQKANQ
jgi:hypothetical protein